MQLRGGGPARVHSHVATILLVALVGLHLRVAGGEKPDFTPISAILAEQCFDCHSASAKEGALDLEQFRTLDDIDRARPLWKTVFDVVEAGQMPLPNSGYALKETDRDKILFFVRQVLSRPDVVLNQVDPGKPIIRRLSRLEYNNTVRDLFGIDEDIFMFPERLPVADKRYFTDNQNSLDGVVQTSMREFGQKYDVLLPQNGLPGDNRAEYGFSNRGDALNFSPLLMEKYLEMATALTSSERLLRESPVLQELLGTQAADLLSTQVEADNSGNQVPLSGRFADRQEFGQLTRAVPAQYDSFVSQLTRAYERGSGGTFDIPQSLNNRTIPGKGGLLKLRSGRQMLTVNPNIDLWLASFNTAQETSGEHLLTNRKQGEKQFELTFDGDASSSPEILQLGVCVLARRNQSGTVRLSAILASGRAMERTAEVSTRNVFISWVAPAGEKIVRLAVDGREFSGDYVLLDDFGFILRDVPQTSASQSSPVAEPTRRSPIETSAPLSTRVAAFMRRAYRRPITSAEIRYALQFVDAQQAAGETESGALKRWVQSTLVSPEFLFRIEPVSLEDNSVRRLAPHELANRLSYFLWASMPDEALLKAVEANQLSTTESLRGQVQRMLLRRSHARELSESFAVQWLRMDQLYASQPDRQLYKQFYSGPQGKSTLHGAMMTEALLLFETVLAEDRSILDLFAPNFTWLNQQLAELYGLQHEFNVSVNSAVETGSAPSELQKNATSSYWLRTSLPDRTRGGVITMAGPLTLTSLPFRTSPVKRGAWLLETIFNRPPNEPKVAFVLDEVGADLKTKKPATLTVRQKFEQHRTHPNCYSCHSRIDPPGFSLEMFDAVGALRTHDGAQTVDATGLWNGVAFNGAAEFKRALLERKEELARGFVEHLMSFALGRKLEHFDMKAVETIVTDSAAHDYRLSSIVEGIALSYPFQHVRNQK